MTKESLVVDDGHTKDSLDSSSAMIELRDAIKKKNCRFKDKVPIGFNPPPLKLVYDIFQSTISEDCYPSPPLLQ